MGLWICKAADSDILPSGNVLVSKNLALDTETPSNVNITVPGSSTRNMRFRTVLNVPNDPAMWASGNATATVNVVTGFSNVRVACTPHREDSAGNNVEQLATTAEQTPVSGNVLTFTWTPLTWAVSAVAQTDRLRLHIAWRTTNATARTCTIQVGDANASFDLPVAWLGELRGRAMISLAGLGQLGGAGGLVGRSLLSVSGRGGPLAGAGAARGRALIGIAGRAAAGGSGALRGRAIASLAGRGVAGGTGVLNGRAVVSAAARGGPPAGAGALAGRGLVGASGRATPSGAGALAGRALLQLLPRGVLADLQAAVGGCVETILAAVRSRYATLVEGAHAVPTLHDNEGEAMPDSSAWVRFSLELDRSFQMDFGGAEQSRRLLGQATAAIYLPFGTGDGEAWELADIINDAFRGQAADGVIYSPPPYPIRRGLVDDRWVLEVVVPFYAQCAEPVA